MDVSTKALTTSDPDVSDATISTVDDEPEKVGRFRMTRTAINATITLLQQVLDNDYGQFEWRVMLDPDAPASEPTLLIHARTRDFQRRCRLTRQLPHATDQLSLQHVVTGIITEADALLARESSH